MGIGEGTGGGKMEIGRGEMGVAVREMPIGGAEERGEMW